MTQLIKWLPKRRNSHVVSFLLRPVFEHKKIKSIFGGFLSVSSLMLSVWIYPVAHSMPVVAMESEVKSIEVQTITTGPTRALPAMTGVSQGYHALHPGIDITAPLGSEIFPVATGKVIKVEISKYEYGRSVVIDHGNGLTSRYAHMGKIRVDEGEVVSEKTVIGEVGVTGHTTGPHLHLEIRKDGVALSPLMTLRKFNGRIKG